MRQAIDLAFQLTPGPPLPTDHGYRLYSALARLLPLVHNADMPAKIAPINGRPAGPGLIALTRSSRLRIRIPAEAIAGYLSLSGRTLDLGPGRYTIGVPEVWTLRPTAALIARCVVIKGFTEPEPFRDAAQRQLDQLGIAARASLPNVISGPHTGLAKRRVLQIRDKLVVGFNLLVSDLNADDSLSLQRLGLGGRQRMGCGFFVPAEVDHG
jgi:CRISPR-associated protein Cas6